MRLVLMGPPGAGKGTLASLLKGSLNIPHISTGDLLREEMKKESELGKRAKEFVEAGSLVPDELITELVEDRLSNDPALENGFMLDGYPRTRAQAEDLDKIFDKINKTLDSAIYLEATKPMIISRLTGRRVCKTCGFVCHIKNRPPKKEGICDNCGDELYKRPDDNEETIEKRLNVYLENTLPIVEYYEKSGKLKKLNGDKESEDLERELLKVFNEEGIPN